jgi:hypothetical protein
MGSRVRTVDMDSDRKREAGAVKGRGGEGVKLKRSTGETERGR